MDENIKIGLIVRNRRLELKMSQEELAHKVGFVDKTGIAKIEAGSRSITQKKLKAFANALELDPLELIGINPETKRRAINYEINMEKFPDLKELNEIIKANYDHPEFLSQLLNYARFLESTIQPNYIMVSLADGDKIPIRVKTLSEATITGIQRRKRKLTISRKGHPFVSKGHRIIAATK